MPDATVNPTQPWASGPREILEHGISLLRKDSDVNRRLAMLIIDNGIELMIRTYLTVIPTKVSNQDLQKAHFPELLSHPEKVSLQNVSVNKLSWYHGLRNALYHGGNGLTVERIHAIEYARHAKGLFASLFECELRADIDRESS